MGHKVHFTLANDGIFLLKQGQQKLHALFLTRETFQNQLMHSQPLYLGFGSGFFLQITFHF